MSRGEQAWEGTLGTLLSTLRTHATEGAERSPKWPRDEKGLADALQRETPVLTDVGVKVENLGKRCVGNGGRPVWRLTFAAAAGGDAEHADHVGEWIGWAARSQLIPFQKLSRTIRGHTEGILAYVATGLSNGLAEGMNAKVRTITKRSYGFHGPGSLIALIFLCCSGLVVPLQQRVPDLSVLPP